MKKIGMFCLIITLLFTALPAAADLIWTPFDEYLSRCDYEDEILTYIAAGEEGWVEAVDLPPDPSVVRTFPNGTEFPVSAYCGEGDDRWARIQSFRDPIENEYYYPNECFIAMKDLVRGFDAAAFEELHRDDLQPFTENFDFCAQTDLEVRITPDADYVLYEIASAKLYGCREEVDFRNCYGIESVYVDGNGDRWVPIKNVFSRPDGWINIGR